MTRVRFTAAGLGASQVTQTSVPCTLCPWGRDQSLPRGPRCPDRFVLAAHLPLLRRGSVTPTAGGDALSGELAGRAGCSLLKCLTGRLMEKPVGFSEDADGHLGTIADILKHRLRFSSWICFTVTVVMPEGARGKQNHSSQPTSRRQVPALSARSGSGALAWPGSLRPAALRT